MNYVETIEYLYSHLPMFSRIGAAAYKKDLHNTLALCEALDNPQQKFKTIHIAGTNGKGSTSHMLAAILQQAGYKTGLYTSPHIKDFGERIRINGEMIAHQYVIDFVERTKKLSEKIQPSFFELTVAMAFSYFAEQRVDVAVIETGLGGRLDSTNVITPELSVITNIGFDHMNLLGNTLESIAFEKAGIIKPGIPVVIGETLPETKPVFLNKAKSAQSPVIYAEEEYQIGNTHLQDGMLICELNHAAVNANKSFKLDLTGSYQTKNLRTVLTCVDVLNEQGYNVKNTDVQQALSQVQLLTGLTGRWQVVHRQPLVICDVAHNADGMKQVMRQLKNDYSDRNLHFILGFVKDKDLDPIFDLLPFKASYYFTQAHMPRALPYAELNQYASTRGFAGKGFEMVNEALKTALGLALTSDVIIICGSFFVIAELDVEKVFTAR